MDGSQAVWRELHGKRATIPQGGWRLPAARRRRVIETTIEALSAHLGW